MSFASELREYGESPWTFAARAYIIFLYYSSSESRRYLQFYIPILQKKKKTQLYRFGAPDFYMNFGSFSKVLVQLEKIL